MNSIDTMRTLFLILLSAGLPAIVQAAGGRHALVLCNQNYKAIGPLRTTLAEAREAEKTLSALGFAGNITVVTDATTPKMIEAVDTFASRLTQADVALFFYGGHAIQAAGENYLLGIDSDPATTSQLAYKALPLGRVLTNLEGSGARLNLLILDCCRDNPLPATGRSIGGTRGLAAMANAPKGTFIAYAADANQQAWDDHGSIGLYGSVLFEKMKTPGLRLEDIFIQTREAVAKIATERYQHQQEPAEYSKLSGEFYFKESVSDLHKPVEVTRKQMTPFSASKVEGTWRVVEKVAADHGGWRIVWTYQSSLIDGKLVLVGRKVLVNEKAPTRGELAAVSRLSFSAGTAKAVGEAEEVNYRGERLVYRLEVVFDESWHSFSVRSFQGEEMMSTLTGSKQ